MSVAAVLLVPINGDLPGLLAEGPCGARPPMAWFCDDYQCWEQWHRGMDHREPASWAKYVERARCALVLAWEGKPVAEGIDRLVQRNAAWSDTRARVIGRLHGQYHAAHIVDPQMGHEVLIDTEGQAHTREALAIAAGQMRDPDEVQP